MNFFGDRYLGFVGNAGANFFAIKLVYDIELREMYERGCTLLTTVGVVPMDGRSTHIVPDPSDEVLARKAKTGDSASLALLIERYQKPLNKYVGWCVGNREEDIQDIVQNTLLNMSQGIRRSYDPDKYMYFWPWLKKVALNVIRDWYKRKKKDINGLAAITTQENIHSGSMTTNSGLVTKLPLPKGLEQEEIVTGDNDKEWLRKQLAALPLTKSQVLRLKYENNLTFEQIALRLEIPLSTVKTRFYEAKSILIANVEQQRGR